MMRFVNPTSNVLNLEPIGLGRVQPGQEVEVEEYLYRPARTAAGGRGKSSIEEIAPQMVPAADIGWVEEWRKAPEPPKPVSRVVTADDVMGRLPPAVVEARRALLEAQAATSAPALPTEAPKPVAKRGRPPKAKMDPDFAAASPGVTSGLMDDAD